MIVTMTPTALLAPQLFNEPNPRDRGFQGKRYRLDALRRAVKLTGTIWH